MIEKQLEYLHNLICEVKAVNSTTEKLIILKKYSEQDPSLFKKTFDYIYSYDKKYWISSDNVKKCWDKFQTTKYTFSKQDDLFAVLDKLKNRDITGYSALNYCIDLIKFLENRYATEIFYFIDKDANANINTALINKVSPESVKEFHVALAERSDEAPKVHEIDFSTQSWMVSRKLDGVRVISYLLNNEVIFYSRTGSVFNTLSTLSENVKNILKKAKQVYDCEFVLDGECCLIDECGKEDFSGIMKEITRKNHTIKKPIYTIFDLIPKDEFDSRKGTTIFKERMKKLEHLEIEKLGDYVKLIVHQNTINANDYEHWIKKSQEDKWEGLMLRDELSVYTGKRSYDLQKVKSFFDNEYKVIGIEIGEKKMLVDGIMKNIECVKSLVIEHKNTHTNVGSGLSDEERISWFKNPELIMGKIITVQYFEESIDSKTGSISLRFPTLKFIHGEKRSV